jgi:hypothetical protein
VTRTRLVGFAAAFFVFLYVEILWVGAFSLGHHHTGDTSHLVAGARAALDCAHLGTWRSCGLNPGTPHTGVFHYPLLQYLPAAFALKLGASEAAALGFLARLSVLSFAGSLGLAWFAFRARPKLGSIAVLGILFSAATYQATSSFGEMLAAFIILAAVISTRSNRPFLIFSCFALACITKETSPPFVALIGLFAGRDSIKFWLPPRRVWLPISFGVLFGIASNLAFNQFRFGSFQNLLLTSPELRVPTWKLRFEFFIGQWISPAAGLFWFWPIVSIILLFSIAVGVRSLRSNPRKPLVWLPPFLMPCVAVVLTFGLANWFAPFGWTAYGHRLAVPLLPALLIATLFNIGDSVEIVLNKIARHRLISTVSIAGIILLALPMLFTPWAWRDGLSNLQPSEPQCLEPIYIEQTPDLYYRCITDTMWPEDFSVLLSVARSPSVPLTGKVVGSAAVLFLTSAALFSTNGPKKSTDSEDLQIKERSTHVAAK